LLDIHPGSAYDIDMSHSEGFPTGFEQPISEKTIIREDGSLNEELLNKKYGLGVEEANQIVSFGNYTGTVAQMLSDEKCPVGGMVSTAYEDKGIEGVAEQFKLLKVMDKNFSVTFNETTMQGEQVKKN
jgi:hypothetical protein